ncbi:deuterosome assembly protein 1 isoform X2 [Paroedura picta]|uniref:deuterosome assembly protein 1 isoform X2 n=1 Tax=Paroedura picta TaxID=143630 RepID=UPI004057714C
MEKKLEVLQEQIMARSAPCDAELQELMHQIDILVNNKKREWQKNMQALEVRMTIRDQELANTQRKLDQKGQEVGLLKQKLDSLQKTKYEMAQNYDAQLQGLKAQFAKLTHSYEKLQLHQLRQNKAHGKGQGTGSQDAPFQMSSLNQKLEEFKTKSKEWDKQETLYQDHLVSLDAQRKLLSEKCSLFQKQAQNSQSQSCCQKLNQKDSPCSQCKMERLCVQRDVSTKPAERNEFFMEKLKSTVSEIAVSRNRLQEENLKLQQEVKTYQRKCQNIDARLAEVKSQLQSREDLLSMVELECQQLRKEVATVEKYKNKEDNQVKLQSAYAQCIKELETKKVEMLVLEQQCENQQKELNQMIDLYAKEHKAYSDAARTPARQDESLRNELIQLTEDTEASFLVDPATYVRRNGANRPAIKMQEKEERPARLEKEWMPQSVTYETSGHCGTQIPAWQGQGDIVSLESPANLPPPRPCTDREPPVDGRSRSPSEAYPAYYGHYLPERNRSDALLSRLHIIEESQMPSPEALFPATATEKFLQEEEKRARDFEMVLNEHIEELQRQSEDTLRKYAGLKQS